ncbi:hypothetical protein ACFL5Q_00095 [Planctomycetota bacterium]
MTKHNGTTLLAPQRQSAIIFHNRLGPNYGETELVGGLVGGPEAIARLSAEQLKKLKPLLETL